MKNPLALTALVLSGSVAAVVALTPESQVTSRLKVDSTPPDRTGALGGYAPVVEKVSPSVVSIIATRSSRLTSGTAGAQSPFDELFKDPRLAPFFQNPRGQSPRAPQTPQHSPRAYGQGSGVVLTTDGYVLTNNHVVEGADEVEVAFDDNGRKYEAKIVGRDPQTDLAVLKIDDADGEFPAAVIGDSAQLKPGDTVLAIGNPFGLSKTVTSGIVSALGRSNLNLTDGGYENFIQTDASINPGNSGGALIDNRGRLIGINTAIFSRTGGNVGIGFAIPVNLAVDIADSLINDGEVSRGYLGVLLGPLTPELAEALAVEQQGVLVNDVVSNAPAQKAGLENGDVITHYNGRPVNDVSKLRFEVGGSSPGDKGEFTIRRNGKEKTLNVELGRLPSREKLAAAIGSTGRQAEKTAEFLDGVKIAPLGEQIRSKPGARTSSGVLVTEVDPSSAAAEAGLRAGDVISEVARTRVASVDDAVKAVEKASGGGSALLLRVTSSDGSSRYLAVKQS